MTGASSGAPVGNPRAGSGRRLSMAVLAFGIATVVCFMVWSPLMDVLLRPVCAALTEAGAECGMILLRLSDGFWLAARVALFGGFVLAFPVIAHGLWRLLFPSADRIVNGAFRPYLAASALLFWGGAALGFVFAVPPLIDAAQTALYGGLLAQPDDMAALLTLQAVAVPASLNWTMVLTLAFGLAAQLPVLWALMCRARHAETTGQR
jgi:sec-independent protein translocase protein TatC